MNPAISTTLDIAGAAALVATVVQLLKFLLEYAIPPSSPSHDPAIRLFVNMVAITVVLINEMAGPGIHSSGILFATVIQGFAVAVVAISGYHLISASASPPAPLSLGPAGTVATWTIPPPESAPNIVPPMPPLPDPLA